MEENVSCTVTNASSNHIDVHILERNIPSWKITCFYGFPERSRRHESWNFLRYLAQVDQLPWCAFGDFNDLLHPTDKMGSNPHIQFLMDGF